MEIKSTSGLAVAGRQDFPHPPRQADKTRSSNTNRNPLKLDPVLVRALDVFISVSVLFYLMPVFLIVAALIYIQDRGPIFFIQPRVGRDGKDFACYKFRSMRTNADALFQQYLDSHPEEARSWIEYRKLERDPRITPIGRFLRKTSLDEFPQLINVIKGEMSLVGPRPIMRDEVIKYGQSFRVYTSVLPGITGLWQVMGRNNLTYVKRVALDRLFARKTSTVLYLVILFMTIPAVLLQKGSR